MSQARQRYLPLLLLLLFAPPLFFINIHNGHSWGDDFAQYIKEARNIASGKPYYLSGYIFNKFNPTYAPPQYPPGFPLLLAPIVKFWGLSFRAMYYFNSFIASCLLFALYAFFRKRTAGITASVCLAILVTYSPYILSLKGAVLADIPCLLFITLYLTCREAATYPWWRILLLIILAGIAIQMRSQAVVLLMAEALLLLLSLIKTIIKRRTLSIKQTLLSPSVWIISGTLFINLLLNNVVFSTPLSATAFYGNSIYTALNVHLLPVAKEYTVYLFQVVVNFFYADTHTGFFNAAGYAIGCAGLAFSIIGFLISISRRLAFDDLFFMLICALIIYFPGRDPRYFLPALPILFYYAYLTFKTLLPGLSNANFRVAAIALTLVYLRVEYGYAKTFPASDGYMPSQKDSIAFRYISQHVNDNDIIMFTKPRALSLFTNKKSINVAWQLTPEQNKRVFDSMQVKYVLVIDGLDDNYFKTYLRDFQHPVDSVHIEDGYVLYSLR